MMQESVPSVQLGGDTQTNKQRQPRVRQSFVPLHGPISRAELEQIEEHEAKDPGEQEVIEGDGDATGVAGYEGSLRWHVIDYDQAKTEKIREASFRNREVSAAHCHFSAAPNKDTPIFALLVRHTQQRGDVFYLGREGMAISRVSTVPLTDRASSPIHLVKSRMYCVYREDQNEVGALIFQFRYVDANDVTPRYALVWVEAPNERQPTDRTMMVSDASQDVRAGTVEEIKVRVYEYVAAQSRVIGAYDTLAEALDRAEQEIPRGRFRLRVENTYPHMSWQSYLGVDEPEFCPAATTCQE
ncbi:MAG: hypothetical protein H0U74_00685 [Bradymonadaceae bacterium]|nr:hypothetical protein [Lujinxingiaceae bacterium]